MLGGAYFVWRGGTRHNKNDDTNFFFLFISIFPRLRVPVRLSHRSLWKTFEEQEQEQEQSSCLLMAVMAAPRLFGIRNLVPTAFWWIKESVATTPSTQSTFWKINTHDERAVDVLVYPCSFHFKLSNGTERNFGLLVYSIRGLGLVFFQNSPM